MKTRQKLETADLNLSAMQKWNQLSSIPNYDFQKVRHRSMCEKRVFKVDRTDELIKNIKMNNCVAVGVSLVSRVPLAESRNGREMTLGLMVVDEESRESSDNQGYRNNKKVQGVKVF